MSELKVYGFCSIGDFLYQGTDRGQSSNETLPYYLKSEADKVIKSIIEGAISMFRDSNRCRGLDLESPLGRIANAAFKHWCFVESISSKNTQLQEDKERLLQNNHHLLDEVERLKEDVADARQKVCEYQEIINEMERQERHQKFKRCLAMAKWYKDKVDAIKNGYMISGIADRYGVMTTCPPECNPKFSFYEKWHKRWLELAKHYKEMTK